MLFRYSATNENSTFLYLHKYTAFFAMHHQNKHDIKKYIFFGISPIEANTDAIQVQVAELAKMLSTYVWYYPFTLGAKKLECTH